jgi:thiamine-phosphate pyrophosphorylase
VAPLVARPLGAPAPEGGRPILCLVVDRGAAARSALLPAVAAAVRNGVDWVQIRDRELAGAALLSHAEAVAEAARAGARARAGRVSVLVNRRLDVALAIGADGVQLGFDAVDAASARRLLGAEALVGVSCHSAAEVRAARGASYALLAPIFAPLSKAASRPPLGLAELGRAAGGLPVLAQGGIDPAGAAAAVAAGAAGVAVTGAILLAPDPAGAAAALRHALDSDAAAGVPMEL